MRLVLIHLVPTPVNVTKVSLEMEKIVKVGKISFADDMQYCFNSEGVCARVFSHKYKVFAMIFSLFVELPFQKHYVFYRGFAFVPILFD